jgi:hypothetical protein
VDAGSVGAPKPLCGEGGSRPAADLNDRQVAHRRTMLEHLAK